MDAGFYALLCELSYSGDTAKVAEAISNLRFSDSKTTGSHWAFIGTDEEFSWIVFRGTNSIEDWLSNIQDDLRPWPAESLVEGIWPASRNALVHHGFLEIWTEYESWIRDNLPASRPLKICGHSLGGALATLASVSLQNTYEIAEVCTFASPRIGNAAFVKLCPPQARYVNSLDPVPDLPPRVMGYEDTCPQIHLPAGTWNWWQRLKAIYSHARHGIGVLLVDSISCHYMANYAKAVK